MTFNPLLHILEAPVEQIEQYFISEGATPPPAWSPTDVDGLRAFFETPLARINVEVDTPVGVADAWLLVRPEGGLLVRTGTDGDVEMAQLVRHSLADIPMVLANFVDLGPRPTANMESFTVPISAIGNIPKTTDSAMSVMQSLAANNVGKSESAAIAILLGSRRSTWRLSTVSRRPKNEARLDEMTVLDAGGGGLWSLQIVADRLRLHPVKPSEVLASLVALLKQTLEF